MDTRCRSSLPMLVVLSLLLGMGFAAVTPAPLRGAAQDDEGPFQLAAPPPAEVAWRYSGFALLATDGATLSARLTTVNGLPADTPAGSFALTGELTLGATTTAGQTTTRSGTGVLTVSTFAPPLAPDEAPGDAAPGLPVATYDATLEVSEITDDAGQTVVIGALGLNQTAAFTFPLADTTYRFGSLEMTLSTSLTGGRTSDPDRLAIFGAATVGDRPLVPTATGPATPAAALSPCEELAAWITATSDRLSLAADQRALLLSGEELAVEDIETALANVTTLLADQQTAVPPPDATTAASLALSTLTTDARALQLILTAAETGDQTTLDQATAILTDAENLSARAVSTLAEISPDCEAAP